MATTHEPGSLPEPAKPPKSSRRKMSWFKQASIGEKLTRLRLPRQTTLDCPNSAPVTAPASAERLAAAAASSRRRIASGSSLEVGQIWYFILPPRLAPLHMYLIDSVMLIKVKVITIERKKYRVVHLLWTIIETWTVVRSTLTGGKNCWIIII